MKLSPRWRLSKPGLRLASPTTDLVAIAVLAGMTPVVAHEFIGHGSVCLAVGGHPTVVSTSKFWCTTPEPVIAAGGPAMNLILGLTLSRPPSWSSTNQARRPALSGTCHRLRLVLGGRVRGTSDAPPGR